MSRAIEKNIALEAEVSRLRHHISVLSRRLHLATLERDGLKDMVVSTMEFDEECGRAPLGGEEVAEAESGSEAAPSVAEMSVESHGVAGEGGEDEAELAVADEAGGRERIPLMRWRKTKLCQKRHRIVAGSWWTWSRRWIRFRIH